jgi:drug/metabolite transporter (DMT)-like permease
MPDTATHPKGGRPPSPGGSALPYVWMLCGSLAFACMGTLTHALRLQLDWPMILVARALLPLLFAMGLALAAGVPLVYLRPWTLWLRSISGSLSMVCMFYALTRLPVPDVFTLNNMFPIWVALLAWPVLGQQPTPATWLAVASSVAGVVLIQQVHIAEGNFAALVAFASSFLTAVAFIGLHRLHGIDARAIVAHFSGVALIICAIVFFLVDRDPALPSQFDGPSLLLLLGVGVTATIGQLFLTKAFAAGTPAKVSVVGLTQIVFSMILDGLLFERSYTWQTLLGFALVVIPTAWMMLHPAD